MVRQGMFNLLYKLGAAKILRSSKKDELTILNLHRISPERDFFWNPITPAHFEAILLYVSKYYNVISFSDIPELLQSGRKSEKPYLILSFDDGYHDFIEYALPLLVKFNLPSNHNVVNSCASNNMTIWTQRLNHIFNFSMKNNIPVEFLAGNERVVSIEQFSNKWMPFYFFIFNDLLKKPMAERLNTIEKKEKELSTSCTCRMMNWKEIIDCSKNRVEIGSHTYNHDVLSVIRDVDQLKREVINSKIEIEEKINKPVTILALPNGKSNSHINEICREANLQALLFVEDKTTPWYSLNPSAVNSYYRINLVDESENEMFLRMELFQPKARRYVRI